MEPISLRTLIVLVAHEKVTMDPRFQGDRLVASTSATPDLLALAQIQNLWLFKNRPKTIL